MLKFSDFLKESLFNNPTILDKNGKSYPIYIEENSGNFKFIVEEDSQEIAHIVLSKNSNNFLPILDAWTSPNHRGLGIWKASMVFIKNYVQKKGYKGIMSEGQYRRPASNKSWQSIQNKTEIKNPISKKLDYFLENLKNDDILDLKKFNLSKVDVIRKTEDYIFYKADDLTSVQAVLDIWPDIAVPVRFGSLLEEYFRLGSFFYVYLHKNKKNFLIFNVVNNKIKNIDNYLNHVIKLDSQQKEYFNKLFKIIDVNHEF
jgi:hypothetical protein